MDAASKKQRPKKNPPGGRAKTSKARVAKVKKLFEEWLQDSSGYDEQVWPQIKKALNESHSKSHNLLNE